jgi:heme-degrading monooxygenase HmoA
MHVHIAVFKWKEGVQPFQVNEALREIAALQEKIPGIVEISCARNSSPYSEGYSHVVLVRGKSREAIEAYRKHPDHVRAAKKIDAMELHGIGVDFSTDQ